MTLRLLKCKLRFRLPASSLYSAFLLLCIVGCGASQVPADSAVGPKVADSFLAQIRAGKVDAAWQSTTAEFKSDEGRESFARFVRKHPFFKQPLTFIEYQVAELNSLPRGQCLYQPPPSAKSASVKVRVAVAQEAGEWKVDGIFVE